MKVFIGPKEEIYFLEGCLSIDADASSIEPGARMTNFGQGLRASVVKASPRGCALHVYRLRQFLYAHASMSSQAGIALRNNTYIKVEGPDHLVREFWSLLEEFESCRDSSMTILDVSEDQVSAEIPQYASNN